MTDGGTEFCGQREHHEYQLYMAIEDIDHTKTKAKSPQTTGFVKDSTGPLGRVLTIAYTSIEEIQADLDDWVEYYNTERTHSGKHCFWEKHQCRLC